MRTVRVFFVGAALGATFGSVTSLINNVPVMLGTVGQPHSQDSAAIWIAIFISLILDAGWSWAAVGFALGWLAAKPGGTARLVFLGALTSATGLLMATAAYYLTDLLFGIDSSLSEVSYWIIRAIAFGLILGSVGTLAHRSGAVGFLARLSVPVGVATSMAIYPLRSGIAGESSAAGYAEMTVWIAAIIGVATVVVRQRLR